MTKYNSKKELIEARAILNHNSNLKNGGVYNDGLEKISDYQSELFLATKSIIFVGASYCKLNGINEEKNCFFIKGFGYAIA